MEKAPVDFYFEFGSPYGYFASHEIEAIAHAAGRRVNWHPYMLGPAFKKTGAMPMREVPLKGPYCMHDWERMSQYLDIPYKVPEKFPANILAPSRGFYWLSDQGERDLAVKFAKASYKAYFAEGRAMWTNEETAEVAVECGIDRNAFLNAVQDAAIKQRLFEAGEAAMARGVFGSPFVIADGEAFWGWDRFPMLKHWLENNSWTRKA